MFKGKGKDPHDPGSYRPISILPSLSKILEIAVQDALLDWLMQQDFIPDSQFGFLPGKSVAMALACKQTNWIEAKSRGDTIGVLGFDLSAAFDTVSSSKLLAKLESTGISGTPLKWFGSYMNDRSQRVLWNDSMSEPRSLSYGVPQGSILGPTLFLVMIADMPKHVIYDVPNAKMTGYTNDSAIYLWAKNVIQLKTDLEKVSNCMISYCRSAGLILDNDKIQFLAEPSLGILNCGCLTSLFPKKLLCL